MKSILSFILILFMMISTFFGGFASKPADLSVQDGVVGEIELNDAEVLLLKGIFETETAWLASLQLDNGAIPMTATKNGTVTLNPYFSDFAALALLDNSEKYAEVVRDYIDWHFSHLNTAKADYNGIDGTIYDYEAIVENGVVVEERIVEKDGKKSYDSTDSYAALFLTVLNKYCEKTDDTEYIASKKADVLRVIDAMLVTLNMGLTYAKPDYRVKYLMDNCEVYEGVKSAVSLLEKITSSKAPDESLYLTKCRYAVTWIEQTIESKLWNAEEGHYEAGIFEDGSAVNEFSWSEFYPCATSQLFPIICGVIDSDTVRAHNLYSAFCDNYSWQTFDIPSEFCWGSNVWAAAIMGDKDSVVTYMSNYLLYSDGHNYPLYNADSARVAMAAHEMLQAVK